MKKALLFLILFSSIVPYAAAQDGFELSLLQKARILKIRTEEVEALKPYEENFENKAKILNSIKNFYCANFDIVCDMKKQRRILKAEGDLNDARQELRIKKAYYFDKYLDVLDEGQRLMLKEIIHDKAIEYAQRNL